MSQTTGFINNSGTSIDKEFKTILQHLPNGVHEENTQMVVPLHYNYDFSNSKPIRDSYNYDYQMFQEKIKDDLKLDKETGQRFQQKPIIQIGQQLITFTYSIWKKTFHRVFPYSYQLLEFLWFLDPQILQNYIFEQLKQFLIQQKQDKEYAENNNKDYWNAEDQFHVVNAFSQTAEQIRFKEQIMDVIYSVFPINKCTVHEYQIHNTIASLKIEHPIIAEFYKGDLFDSSFKLSLFDKFTYENIPNENQFSLSHGVVTVYAEQTKHVKFPLEVYDRHKEGYIHWLYFGFAFTDEKLFIGIGWFKNTNETFPVRLTQDMMSD